MRTLLALFRVAVGLTLLIALLLVGLAVLLPSLVQSEAVQTRLRAAARDATGRDVTWDALDVGLLPPRLLLEGASIAARKQGAPPYAEVRSVGLVMEWMPLLARTVVVDSVVVEGATLRLVGESEAVAVEPGAAPDAKPGAGPDASPGAASDSDGFQLAVREVVIRDARLELEGGHAGPLAGRLVPRDADHARLFLDATGADVLLGGVAKAPGERATLEADVVRVGDAIELRDVSLVWPHLNAQGSLRSEPPAFTGDAQVLQYPLAGGVLEGGLEGRGGSVATRDLRLVMAGQPVALEGMVELALPQFFRLRASGEQLDSNALVRAASGKDFFEGPLTFHFDSAGALSEEGPLEQTVGGKGRFDVGKGRIRGVSLLRTTFTALGEMAEAAVLVNRMRGSTKLERFYEDEFESIGADVILQRGVVSTKNLKIVYRHYTADLRGSMALASGALDLTGELTLRKEAEQEVKVKTIPLAHIKGTAAAPRIDLSPTAIAKLGAREEFYRKRGDMEEELDERLGKGSGKAITDVLDGLLK